jgi:hypothetical protein
MEAAVFFALAVRLPAYAGVLAARLHAEDEDSPGPQRQGSSRPAAASLPPASPAVLAELNARLGSQHFSYAAVPGG